MTEWGAPEEHRITLTSRMSSVGDARDFVSAAVASSLPPRRIEDVLLVTSELVTNAVQYGSGVDVVVDVGIEATAVVLAVSGPTEGVPMPLRDAPAPEHLSGRGLRVVDVLTDNVVIHGHGEVVTVQCTFNR